jgi:hypothetical protein
MGSGTGDGRQEPRQLQLLVPSASMSSLLDAPLS